MQPTRVPVQLDDAWSISGRPHGGYLLRLVVQAALGASPHPDPLAVTALYAAPAEAGPAEVVVEPLRQGRTVGSLRARLEQGGRAVVEVLLSTGTLPDVDAWWEAPDAAPPSFPAVEDCPRAPSQQGDLRIGHLDGVEVRPLPDWAPFLHRAPSGRGEVRAWLRPGDASPADPLFLLVAADALAPVSIDLGVLGWAPTVQLQVLLRARPAPGWLRATQRSRSVRGDWMDEDCDVWDERGVLVAQARQLAGVRVPEGAEPPAR